MNLLEDLLQMDLVGITTLKDIGEFKFGYDTWRWLFRMPNLELASPVEM